MKQTQKAVMIIGIIAWFIIWIVGALLNIISLATLAVVLIISAISWSIIIVKRRGI